MKDKRKNFGQNNKDLTKKLNVILDKNPKDYTGNDRIIATQFLNNYFTDLANEYKTALVNKTPQSQLRITDTFETKFYDAVIENTFLFNVSGVTKYPDTPFKPVTAVEASFRQTRNKIKGDTTGKYKDAKWFIIGLLFADGTIEKLYESVKNYNEVARLIGYPKNHNIISQTYGNTENSTKNLYNDEWKMKTIIDHCNEKKIVIIQSFIDKYNLIKSE